MPSPTTSHARNNGAIDRGVADTGRHLMRVLVLNYEFPPVGGGGGRASADLCRGLAAVGHEVRVVTTRVPGLPPREQRDGYRVNRLWTGRRSRFQASFSVMASYVACGFLPGLLQARRWKPDLIHAHFGVPTGALAFAISRLSRRPYVLTAHLGDVPGGVPEKTDLWFRFVDPMTPPIWRGACRVVAVSNHTKRLVQDRYQVSSIVIPNGIELEDLEPEPAHDPPRLIFAGRFQPQKNLPFLLEALSQIRDLPWQLQMVGDGPQRELLERKVGRLGLAERVRFNGWVATEEVQRHLRASDLLVMPSVSEGLPVVAVQALAHGVAVAASEAGGLAEVVNDGVNGARCPVDDFECYVAALRRCLEDRGRLTAMKAASLVEAERYDIRRVTRAYERVFQQAVAQ